MATMCSCSLLVSQRLNSIRPMFSPAAFAAAAAAATPFTPLKGDLSHIAGLAAASPLRCWCCLDGASQTVTHSHPLFSLLLPTLLRSHLQVQLLPEPSLGVDFVIRLATALRSKPQGMSRSVSVRTYFCACLACLWFVLNRLALALRSKP